MMESTWMHRMVPGTVFFAVSFVSAVLTGCGRGTPPQPVPPPFLFIDEAQERGVKESGDAYVYMADMNADGHPDMLIEGDSDNMLYSLLNNGEGSFSSVSTAGQPFGLKFASGDINNDGIDDLAIKPYGPEFVSLLSIGNGAGAFDETCLRLGFPYCNGTSDPGCACYLLGRPCMGDVDGDSDIDIFFPVMYQQRYDWCREGQRQDMVSRLFLNDGHGRFMQEDLTSDTEPASSLSGAQGVQCTMVDYDSDGLLDIFVSADRHYRSDDKAVLFRQDSEVPSGRSVSFTKKTSGVPELFSTRNVRFADFNGDGQLDILAWDDWPGDSLPIKLFLNMGESFEDATESSGIAHPDSPAGSAPFVLGDFDGDGDTDIMLHVSRSDCSQSGCSSYLCPRLLLNDGTAVFREFLDETALSNCHHSWLVGGMAVADVDGDGALDVMATSRERNRLYMNQRAVPQWLKVRVVNSAGRATAYGAQVRVFNAGTTRSAAAMSLVDAGDGYTKDGYDAYFGLGGAAEGDRFDVEVLCGRRWLTKAEDPKLAAVRPNQILGVTCTRAQTPAPTPAPTLAPTQASGLCSFGEPLLITGHHGRQLSHANGTTVFSDSRGAAEQWTIQPADGNRVTITGEGGKQLSAHMYDWAGTTESVERSRKVWVSECAEAEEKWMLESAGDGKILFTRWQGTWLQDYYMDFPGWRIVHEATLDPARQVEEWKKWTVTKTDGSPACEQVDDNEITHFV